MFQNGLDCVQNIDRMLHFRKSISLKKDRMMKDTHNKEQRDLASQLNNEQYLISIDDDSKPEKEETLFNHQLHYICFVNYNMNWISRPPLRH